MALYKPKGVMCTMDDEKGRKAVVDLVPGARRARLVPVGRLDRNTAGILLLTNDNSWVTELIHPSGGVDKQYRVVVEGSPSAEGLSSLRSGLKLPEERRFLSVDVEVCGPRLTRKLPSTSPCRNGWVRCRSPFAGM